MQITPTGAPIGAYVTGLDVDRLSESDAAALRQAFTDYGLLIFKGLGMNIRQQLRLSHVFGRPAPKVDGSREHPIIVDFAIAWGRGGNLFVDPNPREAALLGYRRNDVVRTITEEMVPEFRHREMGGA